jgi:addiction module HigA family antidote
MTDKRKIPPTHPGEILKLDFLEPLGLSQNKLAEALSVNPRRVSEIVNGKRSVTADTALRLARFFDVTPGFWMGLQAQYDLDVAEDALEGRLEREVKTQKEAIPS